MALKGAVDLPHGPALQRRVERKISTETGHLEYGSLEIDARTMALLGKRQQLRVGLSNAAGIEGKLSLVSYQRNFGLVSLVAFSTTLIASWESLAW